MYILRGDKLVKLAAERSHFTRTILIRKKYGLVGISLQKEHIHKSPALSLSCEEGLETRLSRTLLTTVLYLLIDCKPL